ncbi:MAG: GNAT family N-acetyltransferase [Acidobacteriota bacterium]
MKFVEIIYGSKLYKEEIGLRDRMLRVPLGLKFSKNDLEAEKDELRYGLLDRDNKLLTCLLIRKITPETAKLRQMAVEENMQGKGVGKFLVERVEEELVKQRFKKIELHARMYAKGFYEKLGYEPVGKEFTEVGILHIKMEKTIK